MLNYAVTFFVVALIASVANLPVAAVLPESSLSSDLNMDSLAVMDLLMELEDKFDVSIPLNMVPEIATVGQLAKTIHESKVGA